MGRSFETQSHGKKRFGDKDDKPKLGYLPEEMMAYYRQVSATIAAGFDDDDPSVKKNFLDNVYAALKDEGVKASQNQTVSRILETLFSNSEPYHLREFFCQFCQHLSIVACDRFASHVLQCLIHNLPLMYDDEDIGEDDKKSIKESLKKLCKHVTSKLDQFMTDTYGSYVLRTLLEVLGGVVVNEQVIHMQNTPVSKHKFPASQQLSTDFEKQFKTIKDNIISLCNFSDHLENRNYCPVLQTVLLILHKINVQEYSSLSQTILEKTCAPIENIDKEDVSKNLPQVVQGMISSHLIELIVSLSSPKESSTIFRDHFKGKLIYYAVLPCANFVLQRLLTCISSTQILKEIVTELSDSLEDVLAVGHVGVLTKLADACKRLQSQQDVFIKAVSKAFHCDEPEDRRVKLAALLTVMQTYDTFCAPPKKDDDEEKETTDTTEKPPPNIIKNINFHGSLILQHMLHFARPKPIVIGLLDLSPAELSVLASHTCGSHVVEALFTSTTVWDRSKDEFLKKLKGFYVQIACTKHGSRCLEGIWKVCTMKNKILIAEELIKGGDRIKSDRFGHFLNNNFHLMKFSTRRKEWMDLQSGVKKKQQMLQAILEGGSSKKKNKKRKLEEPTESKSEGKEEQPLPQKPKLDESEKVDGTDYIDGQEKKKGKKKLNKKKRIKLKKQLRESRKQNM